MVKTGQLDRSSKKRAAREPRHKPSRRLLLKAAIAGGAGAAIGSAIHFARARTARLAEFKTLRPQIELMRQGLHRKAREALDRNQLTRADGYIYTIDAAELMLYFAGAGDADAYALLRDHAESHLVCNEKTDAYAKDFVAWKWKAGEKPDASGTTEALRLARAFWLGAKAFNRPDDAQTALRLIDGYSRHATIDQGIWIIRNYFGFGTRAFASNSFLVDYDPDFIREVADERKDAALSTLADNCYGVVRRAIAPCGLVYDMIQPEVATLYPQLNVAAFSPNDIIQFSNCCTTATAVAHGLPEVSRKVLAFALNRLHDLRAYYLGRTGESLNGKTVSISDYSTLTRLAIGLDSDASIATIVERAMHDWAWFAHHVDSADTSQLFVVTEMLLAMQALLARG